MHTFGDLSAGLWRRVSSTSSSIFDLSAECEQLERSIRDNDVVAVKKFLQIHHGKFPVDLAGSFLDKSSCDSRSRRVSHVSHVSQDVEILLRKSQTLIDSLDRRESFGTESEVPSIFRTSLHLAVQHAAYDVLKLLLKYGVDPNEPSARVTFSSSNIRSSRASSCQQPEFLMQQLQYLHYDRQMHLHHQREKQQQQQQHNLHLQHDSLSWDDHSHHSCGSQLGDCTCCTLHQTVAQGQSPGSHHSTTPLITVAHALSSSPPIITPAVTTISPHCFISAPAEQPAQCWADTDPIAEGSAAASASGSSAIDEGNDSVFISVDSSAVLPHSSCQLQEEGHSSAAEGDVRHQRRESSPSESVTAAQSLAAAPQGGSPAFRAVVRSAASPEPVCGSQSANQCCSQAQQQQQQQLQQQSTRPSPRTKQSPPAGQTPISTSSSSSPATLTVSVSGRSGDGCPASPTVIVWSDTGGDVEVRADSSSVVPGCVARLRLPDIAESESESGSVLDLGVTYSGGAGCDDLLCLPPIYLAVVEGRSQALRLLLRYGASPHVQDRHGCTPLHLACCPEFFNADCVFFLLRYGAKVNAQNCVNVSPFLLYPKVAEEQRALVFTALSRVHELMSKQSSGNSSSTSASTPTARAGGNPGGHDHPGAGHGVGGTQRSGSISRFFKRLSSESRSRGRERKITRDETAAAAAAAAATAGGTSAVSAAMFSDVRDRTSSFSSCKSLRSRHLSSCVVEDFESDVSVVSNVPCFSFVFRSRVF